MNEKEYNAIFKDYSNKLGEKFDKDKAHHINNMIVFFNWCFYYKNSFFVENFNNKYVGEVCRSYNKLKTNILMGDNPNIFHNITHAELRRIKFILVNYIQKYDNISTKHRELTETITTSTINSCVGYIDEILQNIKFNYI